MCERLCELDNRAEMLLQSESADVRETIRTLLEVTPIKTTIKNHPYSIHMEWAYIASEISDLGELCIYYIISADDGSLVEDGYYTDEDDEMINSNGELLNFVSDVWDSFKCSR